MSSDFYRFQIGDISCAAVSDGEAVYPVEFLFPDLTPEERTAKAGVESAEIKTPYICLLIDVGDRRILLDTGVGKGSMPAAGRLLDNLNEAGVEADSIDTVILSHAHPDHIGGLTDDEGRLLYENARYLMSKVEWNFWTSDDLETKLSLPEPFKGTMVSYARDILPSLEDRVELTGEDFEVASGVRMVASHGHTPGHTVVVVRSGDDSLLAVGDAMIHESNFQHPDWRAAPDFDPEQTVQTRKRLLNQAASDEALFLAYHFDFPGLGHVLPADSVWEWKPLEM